MKHFILAAAVAALGLGSMAASAATFNVVGANSPNTTATVDFSYDGVNTLTIGITNTATGSTDPRITGFAFNAPTDVTGVSALTAAGTGNNLIWSASHSPNGINTPGNNGFFDIAGLTGPNFNGGNANAGILLNGTGIFNLVLTGNAAALAALTENSFLSLLSFPQNNNSDLWPFAVRFQRLSDGLVTSDVAFGGPDMAPIPLPAAGWLLLAGVGGLAAMRRRRRAA